MPPNTTTVAIDWSFILDKLRREQCLLVLGPEAYTGADGITHREQLLRQLDIGNNPNIVRHYADDDLFLFDQPYKRTLVCHQIQSFYEQAQPSETLRMIAEIPFNIILTVTPDGTLAKAFEAAELPYQFGYYKKDKDPQPVKKATKQLPLIYNTFGYVESEESIVLTHNDLYDYFKSIFAHRSMPEELKTQLREVKNIIFLGVPFEKWYMQLLLRELEIHRQEYAFIRFAANQTLSDEERALCVDQFQINFVARNLTEFVRELHRQCADKGLLRSADSGEDSRPQQIRRLVSNAKLDEAIEMLREITPPGDLADEVSGLAGRYRRYKLKESQGVLYEQDKDVQYNQISTSLLDLLKEVEAG